MPRSNRSTCPDFLEQRIERLVEQFEPRHFGIAQIDDDAGALRRLDARLAHRVAQPHRGATQEDGVLGVCVALTLPNGLLLREVCR